MLPRSGPALKTGVLPVNTPGLIDSGYRGELGVAATNLGTENQIINPGERIAQIVLLATPKMEFEEVDELDDTLRGAGGFGSTGLQ